ncbi:MAG: signal peptidase I [Planctomycetota bacterium]|jgi:signal peptidase I
MKKILLILVALLLTGATVAGIVFALYMESRYESFVQRSSVMVPTIKPGEKVLADKKAYTENEPARWDIVVFRPLDLPDALFCMRIVGLPGETLLIGREGIRINGSLVEVPPALRRNEYAPDPRMIHGVEKPFRVPAGSYFVLGDNETSSRDSRHWGGLPGERIIGKVDKKTR